MSVVRDIKDLVLGRPAVKVVAPPLAPLALAQTPPPAFLSANIKPDTREFLIVFGAYDFAVAKSFAQPVVGLCGDWRHEYATLRPFATMTRGEIVISRVVPKLPAGTTDCDPEATKAAAASTDQDTNIGFLFSFLRNTWICDRCVLSNAGVFQMAQERYESRHFPTHRKKYLEHFMKMTDVRTRQVAALCAPPPPSRPINAPVLRPARQVCKDQAHWNALPETEQAMMIGEEQSEWMNRYTPTWSSPRRTNDIGVTTPQPTFDEITSGEGWKQPPSASEKETMASDDWK
jgi:hypothetical protein